MINGINPDAALATLMISDTQRLLDNPERYGLDGSEVNVGDFENGYSEKIEALCRLMMEDLAEKITTSIYYAYQEDIEILSRRLAIAVRDYGYEGLILTKTFSEKLQKDLCDEDSLLCETIKVKVNRESWGDLAAGIPEAIIGIFNKSIGAALKGFGIPKSRMSEINGDPAGRLFNPDFPSRYRWAGEMYMPS